MDVRGLSRERASTIKEFYWSNSGKNIDVETIRKANYCVVCQENKKYIAIGLVYHDEEKPLYWKLKDLVVDLNKRNLGIGTEMIQFLQFDLPTIYNIQHNTKEGIIITISLVNKRLVSFFERLEFVESELSYKNSKTDRGEKNKSTDVGSMQSDFIFIKSK